MTQGGPSTETETDKQKEVSMAVFKQDTSVTRPHREEFLIYGAPLIGEEEIEAVTDCMRSGWLGTGPRVSQFEELFRDYVGSDYASAVNSCTAALHLSMRALGLQAGDEVIAPAMTFCATVNAIIHAGCKPVIADVDSITMNLDPVDVETRITPKTRAIIAVHFAGRPCDMTRLMDVADRHNLVLIEDCAHAIETTYHGKHAGTFGAFGCFSFYVTKNVVTGEGGMIVTASEEMRDRVRVLALHGMSRDAWKRYSDDGYRHYQVVDCGYKYNMMDLQAAIGIPQLARVEQNWERRRDIWQIYQRELADLPLTLPAPPEPETRHAYHLYTVRVADNAVIDRDTLLTRLTKEKIGVGVHYLSLAEHPFYQETFGWQPSDVPRATRIGQTTLSLPLSAAVSDADVADVIAALRRCVQA